jgi:hypothetical protein
MGKLTKYIGMGMLAFSAGFLGGNLSSEKIDKDLEERIERVAEEKIEKIQLRTEVVLPSGVREKLVIPDSFSKNEEFEGDDYDYWRSKLGFKYGVEDIKYSLRDGAPEDAQLTLHYNKSGVSYDYSLTESSQGVSEKLNIFNYDGQVDSGSFISIRDSDHDGVPDRISIMDERNNTTIYIIRDRNGNLKYENCDEKTARALFDLYSFKFANFQNEHDVRSLIAAHEPKMEIKEIRF